MASDYGFGGYFGDSQGILALGGTNTYQGSTTINSGTILVQSNSALPAATAVYIDQNNGSTLDLGGYNATIAGLFNGPNGGGTITNSGTATSTLTVNGGGAFSGVIQDGQNYDTALTKTGTGTLTLTGQPSIPTARPSAAGRSLSAPPARSSPRAATGALLSTAAAS